MPEELGSLHSARLSGNVLFFLCAVLVGLSFADPEVRPIDKAIRQLTAIKAAFFEDCIDSEVRSKKASLSSYFPSGPKVPKGMRLPNVFFWNSPGTIEELNTAVHGRHRLTVVHIGITPKEYEQEWKRLGSPPAVWEIQLMCGFGARNSDRVKFLGDGSPVILNHLGREDAMREVINRCREFVLFWDNPRTPSYRHGSVIPITMDRLSTDELGGRVITIPCLERLKIPYIDPSGWLTFGALHPYWAEIYGMTPDEAIRYLRARHEAEHRPVSLLGVSFESPVVFNVAPPVLLFFLVLFSIHLKQLRRQLEAGETLEDPSVWIALYPSREALGLVFFTVLVLPVAASISLVMRLEDPLRLPFSLINAVLILACVGLSWRNTRTLLRIRSLVRSRSEGLPSSPQT